MDGTPTLLTAKSTWLFPEIVGVGEDGGTSTTRLDDARDGSLLLFYTRASSSVTGTSGRPSTLEVNGSKTRADSIGKLELGESEFTSIFGSDFSVEEWVEVSTSDVDGGTEDTGVFLPDVEGLGGGDLTSVSSACEG